MVNRPIYYRLIGRLPVPCDNIIEWARYMEDADRHVAVSEVGELCISTVFLGLDHAFLDGPPMLFETMIFGGEGDDFYQERCETWEQAEQMHEAAVVEAHGWLARAEAAAASLKPNSDT